MSDQGIWFKLWCSSVDDLALDNLDIGDFGRWCKLGAYTKRHGSGGILSIESPARTLCSMLQVADFSALQQTLLRLPNVEITCTEKCEKENVTCNGQGVTIVTVTFKNWQKYQGDNSIERVRKFRQRVTANVTAIEEKRREEKRREEKRVYSDDEKSPLILRKERSEKIPLDGPWPSVFALVSLYNEKTPDELPAVSFPISEARQKKARDYLRQFPEQSYWEEVFQYIHNSAFLKGLRPSNGHGSFRADFDWLLSKGKDQTENVVKVHDGRYIN